MAKDEELSGIDTWHLVAPILARFMEEKELGLLGKAYVKVYCALKFWDEHHKEKDAKEG